MNANERDRTFSELLSARQEKNFQKCKTILVALCEKMDFQELVEIFCSNLNTALAIHELFCITGLNQAKRKISLRKVFLFVGDYIYRNSTPEWRASIKGDIESDYEPVGYDEGGKPIYDPNDLAAPFGMTGDELTADLEILLALRKFRTPEGVTIN